MTTFDRHVLARLSRSYVLLVAALIVFFIVLHYVEYIDDFYDRGATLRQVFLVYYPSYIPEIVRLISPLAVFMSAVYLMGRLSQSLQIASLQTAGVSLYRLLVPFLVVGITITAAMFWFNGWIVPTTNKTVVAFEQQYLRDAQGFVDVNDVHRHTNRHGIVSVGFYNRDDHVGHSATLQQFSADHRLLLRVDAQRMTWIDSLNVWRFENAVRRTFDSAGVEVVSRHARLDTTLNVLPLDFARTERDVESMTIPQARSHVASLERAGAGNLGRARVQYHSKYAYPVANLILALLGGVIASVRRRGGQAIQIGIGLVVAFVYLTALKLLEPFGFTGSVSPQLAAWAPHAVFLAFTAVCLLTVRK